MGDDNALPPSKKRAAGREISRDNPGLDDEEDVSEQETGTFKRASDEVLAGRRIVKVGRQPASSAPFASTSNPFAGIHLVLPVSTTAANETKNELQDHVEKAIDEEDKKDDPSKETDEGHKLNETVLEEKAEKAVEESSEDKEKVDNAVKAADEGTSVCKGKDDQRLIKETETMPVEGRSLNTNIKAKDDPKQADDQEKIDGDNTANEHKKVDDKEEKKGNNSDAGAKTAPMSSFQQLSSSKNAFTGLAGTGFSSSAFSFGSISKDGSPSGTAFAFGSKTDQPSLPSLSFDTSNNGSTPLFSSTVASGNKSEGAAFPSMHEIQVATGEENEQTVFTADSALFEFSEGGWKERGKGEVKVNVSNSGTYKARLVMRARGNYRLILNANLYPDMKLTKMDKKGITFACVNSASEGKTGLATFALKFKESSIVQAFSATFTAHKGEASKAAPTLKTPENSSKTAEELGFSSCHERSRLPPGFAVFFRWEMSESKFQRSRICSFPSIPLLGL